MSSIHKNSDLSDRVRDGLRARLNNQSAATRLNAYPTSKSSSKKMRIVLLDLNNAGDIEKWQMLHNDKENYEVISSKESHQKNEYYVRVIYYELGDDLPNVQVDTKFKSTDEK